MKSNKIRNEILKRIVPGYSENTKTNQSSLFHMLICVFERDVHPIFNNLRGVRVPELLALPFSDHGVSGSNHARGEILSELKWRFSS